MYNFLKQTILRISRCIKFNSFSQFHSFQYRNLPYPFVFDQTRILMIPYCSSHHRHKISVFTFLTLQFSNTVEQFIPSIVSPIFHDVSATFVEGAWNSIPSNSRFRARVITIAFVAWIRIRRWIKNIGVRNFVFKHDK